MTLTPATPPRLTTAFTSEATGNIIRTRSVSKVVLAGNLAIPLPPRQVLADWQRDMARLAMVPGDVEEIPLGRTRMRWQDYTRCVQAMHDWTGDVGLPGVLAASEISLMACLGARYHHDSEQYSHAAFCNVFLSEDTGWDVHFPAIGVRIPLTRGTAMVFDTGQPHGVIRRGSSGFDIADVVQDADASQVFLSWEMPIEDPHVATALGITFDASTSAVPSTETGQLLRDDLAAQVCPDTGKWLA